MTREERLDEEYKRQGLMVDFDICEFINRIYDDFESRTCENCLHYQANSLICYKEVVVLYEGELSKDFGCNKWEAKNEK